MNDNVNGILILSSISYIVILIAFSYFYSYARKRAVQKNCNRLKAQSSVLFILSTYFLPFVPLTFMLQHADPTGTDGLGWLIVFIVLFGTIPMLLLSYIVMLGVNKKIESAEQLKYQ